MSRWRDERGSIAPLVPILIFGLFLLGGLLVDGSRTLNARGNAQAYAEEAARAGATAVEQDNPILTVDPTVARQRIHAYCSAIQNDLHAHLTVDSCGKKISFSEGPVCGNRRSVVLVHTEVKLTVDVSLLGMIGVKSFTVTGAANARPYEGTTADNAC